MSPSRQNNFVSSYSFPLAKSFYSVISAFCTEDNILQCISYINQVWKALGLLLLLLLWLLLLIVIITTWSVWFICKRFIVSKKITPRQGHTFNFHPPTGARLTGPLLYVYWGHLTRGDWPECSTGSECHVWAATDSQANYEHCRRAWERAAKEIQHHGAYADEQYQTQGMYNRWSFF